MRGKPVTVSAKEAKFHRPADMSAYHEIMERFAFARSLLSVCHRSLSCDESATSAGDEADVLAEAIEKIEAGL